MAASLDISLMIKQRTWWAPDHLANGRLCGSGTYSHSQTVEKDAGNARHCYRKVHLRPYHANRRKHLLRKPNPDYR
jgi:hypothetical protein